MSQIELIKSIREKTGLPFGDIQKALLALDSNTNEEKVIEYLRKEGILKQAKRSDRITSNGSIFGYVHEGRIGVLLEVKCETDFVARSKNFQDFGNDIALHIAAYRPLAVKTEDINKEYINKELEIYKEQLLKEKKPKDIVEKILDGKKKKLLEENSLLNQVFLKDSTLTVEQYLSQVSLSTGEKIEITRFVIFSLT